MPDCEKDSLLSKKKESTEDKSSDREGYFRGDGKNFALLLMLYTLQGVAIGLTNAMPIILQNKHISYSEQASFSFVFYPFSGKLLWAPILDAVYSARFGKRKSWLVPSQILLGLLLLFISANFDHWLGDDEDENGNRSPNTSALIVAFFFVYFLTATQDIALDGWALTLFQRRNLGFVGTCTLLGQALGSIFGNNILIMLESADFCNRWFRTQPQPTGIISYPPFICFWAIVFLVTTTIVAIFVRETYVGEIKGKKNLQLSILHSYKLTFNILRLKPVMGLMLLLLFGNVAFVSQGEVSSLKMIDGGFGKDKVALLGLALVPVQLCLPIILRRFVLTSRQLSVYAHVVPFRLVLGILDAYVVNLTYQYSNRNFDAPYYALVFVDNCLGQVGEDLQSITQFAFMASVCDPRCGATYWALLATLTNLGETWTSSAALALVDVLSLKKCVQTECANDVTEPCVRTETCSIYVDGFYIEVAMCTLFGVVWWFIAKKIADRLHGAEPSEWLVDNSDIDECDQERTCAVNYIKIPAGEDFVEPEPSAEQAKYASS